MNTPFPTSPPAAAAASPPTSYFTQFEQLQQLLTMFQQLPVTHISSSSSPYLAQASVVPIFLALYELTLQALLRQENLLKSWRTFLRASEQTSRQEWEEETQAVALAEQLYHQSLTASAFPPPAALGKPISTLGLGIGPPVGPSCWKKQPLLTSLLPPPATEATGGNVNVSRPALRREKRPGNNPVGLRPTSTTSPSLLPMSRKLRDICASISLPLGLLLEVKRKVHLEKSYAATPGHVWFTPHPPSSYTRFWTLLALTLFTSLPVVQAKGIPLVQWKAYCEQTQTIVVGTKGQLPREGRNRGRKGIGNSVGRWKSSQQKEEQEGEEQEQEQDEEIIVVNIG